ncbi:hypothetical protein ABZ912_23815 [Nonomuraea angiospora]|uniref:hypothetical protein n=1 Tax=Nonomuraea angiospora TaxID=46172 RepID=UPI0033FFA2EF
MISPKRHTVHHPENDFGARDVDGPAPEGTRTSAVDLAGADAERQVNALLREVLPGHDPERAAADFQRLISDWR